MRPASLCVFLFALLAVVAACSDDPPYSAGAGADCVGDGECPEGQSCQDGECVFSDEEDVGTPLPDVEVGEPDVTQAEDVVEGPGIGDPCDEPEDCPSGYCIEVAGDARRVCTDFCSPESDMCPEGFVCAAVANSGADRVFLCFPETDFLCSECEADRDCGGLSDRCLDYLDGRFCGRDCQLQACPEGYDCLETEGEEGSVFQCRAEEAICSACFDPDNDGYGVGPACLGGDCQEDEPGVHEGAEELCNASDDDCDGELDEDFDFLNDASRCGDCETVCAFEGAQALCVEGECVRGPCLEDRYDIDGRADNGCEYFCERSVEGVEVCNGADDNCDGEVDEGNPGGGGECDTGQEGVCAIGVLACDDGAVVCERQSAPTPEVCNGADDNCDGQEDEGDPGGGGVCDTGEAGICAPGTRHCEGGELVCVGDEAPRGEVCNGADDDCNGAVDGGCPASLGTGGDRNLTAFGGGGGSAFRLVCGAGQVAVGVDLRSASELDRVQVICQRIALNENRGVDPYTYQSAATGGQSRTGTAGGGGGDQRTMTCPAGSFLHRIRVRSGSRIDQLSLTCARADYVGYPGGGQVQITDTLTNTYGGNGGTLRAETRCGTGEFIAGFHGRAGGRVDQIGAVCRAISVGVR